MPRKIEIFDRIKPARDASGYDAILLFSNYDLKSVSSVLTDNAVVFGVKKTKRKVLLYVESLSARGWVDSKDVEIAEYV